MFSDRGGRRPLPWWAYLALFAVYGPLFAFVRHLGAGWTGGSWFSLWFPAAGLRFALLWRLGPKASLGAALAETAGQLLAGTTRVNDPLWTWLIGILGPALAYGAVIAAVRGVARRNGQENGAALVPFALAALLAPIAASLPALSWAVPMASAGGGGIDPILLGTSIVSFILGDMLGVLLIAPPLLWLAGRGWRHPRRWSTRPRPAAIVEAAMVVALAIGATLAIDRLGHGLMLGPALLAAGWAGLRTGGAGAWIATVATMAIVLPRTIEADRYADQLALHMMLVSIAAGSMLAGSYAQALAEAGREVARRGRLLAQAERLKTLRAMSVAVLHEVSQPLSTLSIEAGGLARELARDKPRAEELRPMAALIARKVEDLSALVGRLRRFGSRGDGEQGPVAMTELLFDACQIVRPEARARGIEIVNEGGPEANVRGEAIELRQLFVNLLRNAVTAAAADPAREPVRLRWREEERSLCVKIRNRGACGQDPRGMGVGLIVARTIAEAHGGRIVIDHDADDRVAVHLPREGRA